MKRRPALCFAFPISRARPRGTGTLCLRLGAACAHRSPARGFPPICSRAGKPVPASPARTRAAAGSVPLRPPPPAAFDLSAVVLGEPRRLRGFAAWSPGAGSPPRPLQLGGEKLYFHLHPSIPLPALELFLEPKGRKGRGLAFLPPLCSCPFIPLFPAAANGFA